MYEITHFPATYKILPLGWSPYVSKMITERWWQRRKEGAVRCLRTILPQQKRECVCARKERCIAAPGRGPAGAVLNFDALFLAVQTQYGRVFGG